MTASCPPAPQARARSPAPGNWRGSPPHEPGPPEVSAPGRSSCRWSARRDGGQAPTCGSWTASSQRGRLVRSGGSADDWFDASRMTEPYRIEGKKTTGSPSTRRNARRDRRRGTHRHPQGAARRARWVSARLEASGWPSSHEQANAGAGEDSSTIAFGQRAPAARRLPGARRRRRRRALADASPDDVMCRDSHSVAGHLGGVIYPDTVKVGLRAVSWSSQHEAPSPGLRRGRRGGARAALSSDSWSARGWFDASTALRSVRPDAREDRLEIAADRPRPDELPADDRGSDADPAGRPPGSAGPGRRLRLVAGRRGCWDI